MTNDNPEGENSKHKIQFNMDRSVLIHAKTIVDIIENLRVCMDWYYNHDQMPSNISEDIKYLLYSG